MKGREENIYGKILMESIFRQAFFWENVLFKFRCKPQVEEEDRTCIFMVKKRKSKFLLFPLKIEKYFSLERGPLSNENSDEFHEKNNF